LNFSPYVKEHAVRPLEGLTADLDLLFSSIDTLLLLHISGGEPFTHPRLAELIEHVSANWRGKLGRLEMTTNGTILPSERLLLAMHDSGLYLTVDDYRDAVPQYGGVYGELLRLLDSRRVAYRVQKADAWIDLRPFAGESPSLDGERLRAHFDACAAPWQEYRDGKLWLCNYAAYADMAGIQAAGADECFDIGRSRPENRRALIEFRLGCSAKGYTEFCRRCAGYGNNPYVAPVAEQL
jgi:hypothetical protein